MRNAAVAFEDFILYLNYNVGMQDKDRMDVKMNIRLRLCYFRLGL